MRIPILVVCFLVLTSGCIGNTGDPVQPGDAEGMYTESTTPPQQPKTPSSAEYDVDVERIEYLIHKKMNDHRQENGFQPLTQNKTLTAAAQYKSWEMAQRDYFSHTGPNGSTHTDLREKYGLKCDYSGQNIYKDNSTMNSRNVHLALKNNEKIASAAVRVLLNSPGHRENALSSNYDSQGIGVFVDENGTVFVTQELCG